MVDKTPSVLLLTLLASVKSPLSNGVLGVDFVRQALSQTCYGSLDLEACVRLVSSAYGEMCNDPRFEAYPVSLQDNLRGMHKHILQTSTRGQNSTNVSPDAVMSIKSYTDCILEFMLLGMYTARVDWCNRRLKEIKVCLK